MRPLGVDRKDRGCCPGHDKYPADRYGSARSRRARARGVRLSHKRDRARQRARFQFVGSEPNP